MSDQAIITADIVNSQQLAPDQEQWLKSQMGELLKDYRHEFYRGDSLQVYLADATEALRLVLLLRVAAIMVKEENGEPVCDIRAGIGIGEVEQLADSLGSSRGEAFVLSGRGLDDLSSRTDRRLLIATNTKAAAIGMELIAAFTDFLLKKITLKQAEVVYQLLQGRTQQQAADHIGKSLATINQHAKAADWHQLQYLMEKYPLLIKSI